MKSIKEIIGNLRVAMTDARQNESHFESWMILNEAICDAIDALAEQPAQPQQEPATLFEAFQEFGKGWESLAWELCADENGEEACTELIWEGGPIPEPWGDRWLKYEDEAKRLIALVHKHTSPPAQRKPLTDEWIRAHCDKAWVFETVKQWVRAIEAAHGIKENT